MEMDRADCQSPRLHNQKSSPAGPDRVARIKRSIGLDRRALCSTSRGGTTANFHSPSIGLTTSCG